MKAVHNVFRAELEKGLTLPVVRWALLAMLVAPPALAFVSGVSFDAAAPGSAAVPLSAQGFETAGFGQPILILIAALIVGSEYRGGQLAATLMATPARGYVWVAKLTVIALLTGGAATASSALSVVLKHSALGEGGLSPSEFSPGMAANLLGVGINGVLISVIAASVTSLTRTVVAPLMILVPMVLGLTISLVGAIPALRFLPDLAGLQLLSRYPGIGLLEPIAGGLIMAAWAGVLALLAWWRFHARDAGAVSPG